MDIVDVFNNGFCIQSLLTKEIPPKYISTMWQFHLGCDNSKCRHSQNSNIRESNVTSQCASSTVCALIITYRSGWHGRCQPRTEPMLIAHLIKTATRPINRKWNKYLAKHVVQTVCLRWNTNCSLAPFQSKIWYSNELSISWELFCYYLSVQIVRDGFSMHVQTFRNYTLRS